MSPCPGALSIINRLSILSIEYSYRYYHYYRYRRYPTLCRGHGSALHLTGSSSQGTGTMNSGFRSVHAPPLCPRTRTRVPPFPDRPAPGPRVGPGTATPASFHSMSTAARRAARATACPLQAASGPRSEQLVIRAMQLRAMKLQPEPSRAHAPASKHNAAALRRRECIPAMIPRRMAAMTDAVHHGRRPSVRRALWTLWSVSALLCVGMANAVKAYESVIGVASHHDATSPQEFVSTTTMHVMGNAYLQGSSATRHLQGALAQPHARISFCAHV